MKKILITGDKGYIGTLLTEHLKGLVINGDLDATAEGMDLVDQKDVVATKEFPDVDVVIHLAAQSGAMPSIEDPFYDARQNIMGTIRLAHYYAGTKTKIIFTTSGAAKAPESPYGLSKHTAEAYLRMLAPDNSIILRLSSVYGNKPRGVVDTFLTSDKPVVYGDGTAVRDFVHVDDIVKGLTLAMEWEPGEYEMGSGDGTTIKEIADATGKEIDYQPARKGEIHTAVLQNSTPNWAPEINVIDYVDSQS